ncbi:MAG: glutamyl-tRNA amidotransferase [Acidobacteria bacterium]|nr:glutamyl-tRNA amidotransferase [Acidobacteriota bacterium]MBF84758.1 glutamyl-tRNA amidotransferase [Acidobacteriota bacterium]MBU96478.1 glutamyl-tRNA amidotransferase [Dehalococcoidia bacterium]MEC7768085.1 GatB/YqeY domain-containing protein [Acidobacteriota bacterium]
MDLLTRVNEAITSAMRTRDQAALGPLRMLKAALVNRRVELGREPTEDDALKVAASLAKQRRDSISQFERAGRTDLVAQEKAELALLETFLPPPVDEAEVERIVNAAIAETNANTPRDIGRVMKQVMTQVGGQSVDGSAVSALVKRKLSRER